MEKVKHTIINGIIVLISICCIDGGRSALFASNELHILVNRDQVGDIELPHQQQHGTFTEDVKSDEKFRFYFSDIAQRHVKCLIMQEASYQEFSNTIWQPPEFV
jgi:hypothetical protein